MKGLNKKVIEELAQKALSHGNPYKKGAVRFFKGHQEMFIKFGKTMTAEELDEAYLETARKDIAAGAEQRAIGWYDKWYRYCHADEGRAYDIGCRYVCDNGLVKTDEFRIIECAH